ncbi:MAG: SusC/RagA family TonB-linked outer membrane protein [Gemmatimonadaceae bacterium]|nr:SusC/RagA family TonB-linked outer membrane protein [Gemmatimonadaceae bacterium]
MLGRIGMRRLSASILALLLSLTTAMTASAQAGAVVTGTVKSDAGQPLFGANVTIEALNISVGSGEDGRFTINVPGARIRGQQVVLRARAIGYVPMVKTITLNAGSQTQDFELKQDVNRLSQVVVTGVTGATEVKKLPFTVAQVTAEDMPVPGANPLSQLQGKVPGANIVSASGRPGSAPAIILRGPQSINASGRGQDPLIIVDGVISQGSIQDINPQDIENVEVVKGAAASSLYGSRAGNGVIQITTRSGKNAGEGVRFRSQLEYGTSSIENEYQYPKTHFMLMNEDFSRYCTVTAGARDCSRTVDIEAETYRINSDSVLFAAPPVNFANDAGIARNPGQSARWLYQVNPYVRTYNPIRQGLTNGATINSTVDATGRVGRTNFFTSANQFRQEGAVRFLRGYTRNSIRLNVDQQLATSWNFAVRTNFTDVTDWNAGFGNGWFRMTRQPASANLLARDSRGRLYIRSVAQQQGAQNQNPMYDALELQPVNRLNRFIGQATARWQPLLWLDAEANFGYDFRQNLAESQTNKGFRTTTGPATATQLGSVARSTGRDYSLNASMDVTARRNWFSDNLSSRLTLRSLFEAQDSRGLNVSGNNLVVPGLADISSSLATTRNGGSFIEQVRQVGMFLNLDLDWQGKYILSGLVRRDGASLFGAARRWQTYGRGSAAWRISEEAWFGLDAISDMKVRYSLGQAGNRPSFSAQYEQWSIAGSGLLGGLDQLGNPNLRPEVSTEQEFGVDLELFSKYGVTITQANNTIDQQIMPVPVSAIGGFASKWANVGELSNSTFELSVNIPIIQTRDLNYSVRVNYDRTTSEISRLDIPEFFVSAAGQQGSETMFKIVQGGMMGQMFGRRFVTSCGQLPATQAAQCGGSGSAYQKNSDGFIVWVGAGNSLGDGITKNLWMTRLAPANAPWAGGTGGEALGWGMPILYRTAAGSVPAEGVGQALPKYRWSLSQQASWRKFSAYALLDATVGKSVWNEARQWSLGDFMHADADQAGKSVATARPIGYYFRATSTGGVGGLYDVLGPNNNTVEDASFVKLREVTVAYRIGRLAGVGDWSVSMVGRNLLTFTDYKGFDPEVGLGGGNLGSGVLNAIDAFGFPNLRTFSIQIGTSF